MGFHRSIVPTADPNAGPHVVHQFQFVDAGAMSAGTDTLKGAITLSAADIGMVARVGAAAPYDFYVLTEHASPTWEQINGGGGGGGGDVSGPASATDNALARFDGTTGKTIQNSAATLSDAGVLTVAGVVTAGTVDGRDVSVDGAALDALAAAAVVDTDFAGSSLGALIRTGAGAYGVLQHNLAGTVAPGVSDDTTAGYAPGSLWVDEVADQVYFCADAAAGAAVWRQIVTGGGGGVTDHGALTGLGDDDHAQYLLVSGVRAMTGALDMGAQAITNVGNVDGRDVSADGTALDAHIAAANPHSGSLSTAHAGTGGAAHALAVAGVSAGFISETDQAKLNGIASGATATPLSASTPAGVAAAGAVGVATTAARGDHVHAHGNQAGGALHADVVAGGASGFMTGTQADKLAGIETGADVTDAANVDAAGAVMEADFTTTHVILARQGGAGPVALAIPLSSFVGRIASGDIVAMTTAQAKTLLAMTAGEVSFTPNGDIAASTVQAAVVEVRDDTDTKLASKASIAGQLGGTGASPTVLGARETSGPTLLTYGAIADGQVLSRSGTSIIGVAPGGGGGLPDVDLLDGFTAGNHYAGLAGELPGVGTGFLVAALVEVKAIQTTGGQALWGNANFGSDGWWIGLEDNLRFQAGAHIATVETVVSATPVDLAFVGAGLVLVVLRLIVNGANNDLELWIQGRRVGTGTGTGAYVPSTLAPQIGLGIFGNVAENTPIAGVQYLEGTLTDDQLRAHFAECYAAGDVVSPSGHGWTSYSVKRGAPGATWAPSDGTGPTLSRTGAPVALNRPTPRFLFG